MPHMLGDARRVQRLDLAGVAIQEAGRQGVARLAARPGLGLAPGAEGQHVGVPWPSLSRPCPRRKRVSRPSAAAAGPGWASQASKASAESSASQASSPPPRMRCSYQRCSASSALRQATRRRVSAGVTTPPGSM
jgi:hypothetical protein